MSPRTLLLRHLFRVVIGACMLAAPAAVIAPSSALAELPETPALLASLGFTQDEVAEIEAGKLVRQSLPPASERELTAALAFQVPVSPAQLVEASKRDLLDRVDANMISFGVVSAPGRPADFARLALQPDPAARAQAYLRAAPGGALNLSSGEIETFHALGDSATPGVVEAAVRSALLERVESYRTRGLAGIDPYALAGGETRSPAEELRIATAASKALEQHAPAALHLLLSYPNDKPAGTEESFRWSHFEAHGEPTIVLTHVLLIPDGAAWIVAQRQFYVSTGYNAEQAIAAFLPTERGTVVVYGNRTSTDQITGFGGGTKRSLGSKVLSSQLESMFEKARANVR